MSDVDSDSALLPRVAMSWRDVGTMVNESEARLGVRIDTWALQMNKALDDHEKRISAEEDFTIGVKASGATAEKFFSFGRWVLATVIALAGVAVMAIAKLQQT